MRAAWAGVIRGCACMLTQEEAAEVLKLLGGFTQREVSRRTGRDRRVIAKIVSGEWQANQAERQRRQAKRLGLTMQSGKCPDCGARCRKPIGGWPCLGCRIRATLTAARRLPDDGPPMAPLDLRPEHQARYEEVRRRAEPARRQGLR